MVPWYSGRSGDAPVLAKVTETRGQSCYTVTKILLSWRAVQVDNEKVRKMREEFEGATAE